MESKLTAFISGIRRVQGPKQSSNKRNVPGLHPSFKFFDRFYQRYKPRELSQRTATCLVCTLHSNCLTAYISGISRVPGLNPSFKQRAWSAPFMESSLPAFISGISCTRGLKQSSNNRNVPGLHSTLKLFDLVYQRYKQGCKSQRIVKATCLVCNLH